MIYIQEDVKLVGMTAHCFTVYQPQKHTISFIVLAVEMMC